MTHGDYFKISADRRAGIARIAEFLVPGKRVALSTHMNSDGDGCGSECGLARLLKMPLVDLPYDARDPARDMATRLAAAGKLLDDHDFVHVHLKATDDAAHTKNPLFKRDVIEAVDAGLAGLLALSERAVVAVTGDHASPSRGSLLHSGDPTPLVVAAPGLRPDAVLQFGECSAMTGELGRLRAAEVLPLLAGIANRPFFLGHRPGPGNSVAMPGNPAPMPLSD